MDLPSLLRARFGRYAPALPVLALVLTFLLMAFGVAEHHVCLGYAAGPPGGSQLCVSDVSALWGLRDLAHHVFPYGTPGELTPEGTVEYPALTGLFAWFTALPAFSAASFYLITALVVTGVALWAAVMLVRLGGVRVLLFATSPLLVYYGTQNWDLLPVAATVAGIYAWTRRKDGLASVAFAIGACFKLYPLLFLLPLYADVHARKGRRAAWRAIAPGIVTGVLINLPLMARDLGGWWQPFAFQQARPVDQSALSFWSEIAPQLTIPLVNALSGLSLLVGIAIVCFAASRRLEREGAYPVVQVCAAFVALWLLTAKAGSPQYALWLLPFIVVLRVSVPAWFAFVATVLWCHVTFYRAFEASLAVLSGAPEPPPADFFWPVLSRLVMLIVLTVLFMRSELTERAKTALATYGRPNEATDEGDGDRDERAVVDDAAGGSDPDDSERLVGSR